MSSGVWKICAGRQSHPTQRLTDNHHCGPQPPAASISQAAAASSEGPCSSQGSVHCRSDKGRTAVQEVARTSAHWHPALCPQVPSRDGDTMTMGPDDLCTASNIVVSSEQCSTLPS